MYSLFRERLDLPIDDDHDDHLYENWVPRTTSSDSDSDVTPSSPLFFDSQIATNKKDNMAAAKVEQKNDAGI